MIKKKKKKKLINITCCSTNLFFHVKLGHSQREKLAFYLLLKSTHDNE